MSTNGKELGSGVRGHHCSGYPFSFLARNAGAQAQPSVSRQRAASAAMLFINFPHLPGACIHTYPVDKTK